MSETFASEALVGAFFECSWGYDQTNVDFYKVVAVTPSGKSAKVQKWTSAVDSSDHVVPGDGPRMVSDFSDCDCTTWQERDSWQHMDHVKEVPSPVVTKRLRYGAYKGVAFNVASYADAYLWDGNAAYQTPAGFGH